MPRFSGKQADTGVPVTIDKDRYAEGDSGAILEGGVALGEKPANVVFPIQLDASGYLKVNLVAGGYAQHEYQDGDVNTSAYGHLILGDDGANLQSVKVGANGRLQVEVVVGDYDAVQYQDGAAVASPFGFVSLGHDGSNVYPVVVDNNGYLQVDIRNLPADTFAAEGQALGKGVLLQGDDGVDRKNVAVDAAGNVQTDIVGSLPAGSAAIGKLAANDGVDIGDVDVKSLPADTLAAEGQALGKGVLLQGDDGVDRHNVAVNASGHVETAQKTDDTLYSDNDAVAGAKGRLMQGFHGNNIRIIHVDVNGDLQCDIVGGLPVGTNCIGKVKLTDGVDDALIDASKNLHVVDKNSDEAFKAADQALGKGVLIQASDAVDRRNLLCSSVGALYVHPYKQCYTEQITIKSSQSYAGDSVTAGVLVTEYQYGLFHLEVTAITGKWIIKLESSHNGADWIHRGTFVDEFTTGDLTTLTGDPDRGRIELVGDYQLHIRSLIGRYVRLNIDEVVNGDITLKCYASM